MLAASPCQSKREVVEGLMPMVWDMGLDTALADEMAYDGLVLIIDIVRWTELDILRFKYRGYEGLRQIIRGLARFDARLSPTPSTRRVAVRNQIEMLDIPMGAYKLLRKAGIRAISQLRALDRVAIEKIVQSFADVVLDALGGVNGYAPISQQRRLRDLRMPRHWRRQLSESRVLDMTIAEVRRPEIQGRLVQLGVSPLVRAAVSNYMQ